MMGMRDLSPAEVARIRAALLSQDSEFGPRNVALFECGVLTGGRISELLQLRVRNVYDVKAGVFHEAVTFERRTTKRKRAGRSIPVSDLLDTLVRYWPWLQGFHGTLEADDPLFPSRKSTLGGRLHRVQGYRILKAAFRAAGITGNTGTHSLRKTFAMSVLDSGGGLHELQALLGHASLESTGHYVRARHARLQQIMMAVGRHLAGEGVETPAGHVVPLAG